MPVDVSGRIVYNPEADKEYSLECKQLGISDEGTGTIENDIETLRDEVIAQIAKEFHVSPESVNITGYVLSLKFSIEGPRNHTLDKFMDKKSEERPDGT